ncbi:hypothetical protein ACFSC4_20975 [Deinococcus malanensis]|uniref:hypothetical protein n=1 Tax=Deinococcus malanensis TaxID=1706855 RepID=UPI00362BBBD1
MSAELRCLHDAFIAECLTPMQDLRDEPGVQAMRRILTLEADIRRLLRTSRPARRTRSPRITVRACTLHKLNSRPAGRLNSPFSTPVPARIT